MNRPLAFALGGGGARGALQVGALRALLEAGYQPDLLVGTSIGAVNATYLALHGPTLASLPGLIEAWHDAAAADLLPANYLWLTVRVLFNRVGWRSYHRMRDFFIAHGARPELRFADLGTRLILVAADLNTGLPVLYGADPQQSVLEGLLASTALPPWVRPLEKDGQFLIDGGVVSTLPIEPALAQGAREIIALDLADPREVPVGEHGFGPFLAKLMNTIEQRQQEMELALAEARGVPVWRITLQGEQPVPIWDFSRTDELIARGYTIAGGEVERISAGLSL
ncbi:MAG: patatin-like phospholipase family protein [Anaerolineae bacterium]